jgi:hypothetical protein
MDISPDVGLLEGEIEEIAGAEQEMRKWIE